MLFLSVSEKTGRLEYVITKVPGISKSERQVVSRIQ